MFCISILSQYGTKEVVERIEDSLELLADLDNNLPLGVSTLMSISMFEQVHSKMLVDRDSVAVESVIFANSLIGTTIQDGGKRERSNDVSLLLI